MAGYNAEKAVQFANEHAHSHQEVLAKKYKPHWCARFTNDAISAPAGGGLPVGRNDAKFCGPLLEKAGFREVTDGSLQKGDVAVIQNYKGGSSQGHMCMWNGSEWVSDFHQGPGRSPYPGDGYRAKHPPYKIYRYQGQGQASSGTGVQGTTALGTKLGKAEGLVFIGPEKRELSHQLAELQGGGKVIRCNRTVFVGRKRLPAACVGDETTDGPITIGEDSVQMA